VFYQIPEHIGTSHPDTATAEELANSPSISVGTMNPTLCTIPFVEVETLEVNS